MTYSEWIKTFFEEKEIAYKSWDIIDSTGMVHFIDSDVVKEYLEKITDITLQSKIKNIIVQIDFANGDILHFLKHCAKGIIEQYNGVLATG